MCIRDSICIDTRNVNTFFKPDGKDVVAYGEQLMTSTVGEWTQYTLSLIHISCWGFAP